jgi:transposase
MLSPAAGRRAEILTAALDYISDAEAAKALGVHRTTIAKYRRQQNFSSQKAYEKSLDGKPGRKPKTMSTRDVIALIRCFAENYPKWTAKRIASAMREAGHKDMTSAFVEGIISSKHSRRRLDPSEKMPPVPDFLDDILVDFVLDHPIRSLAMLSDIWLAEGRAGLELVKAAKSAGFAEFRCVRVGRLAALQMIRNARQAKETLKKFQGQGLTLRNIRPDEIPDDSNRRPLLTRKS